MPAITSQLDPRSQDFQDNVAFHRALVEELDARLARAEAFIHETPALPAR